MLKTLIKKEIFEALLSFRFLFGTLSCLILIPIGIYVNMKEYEQRRVEYQEIERLYQERSAGQVYINVQAEGYRPPSILSVFSFGLESFLPNKVVTSENGDYQISKEQGIGNPESSLFGKADFLFNVGFIISLLGLIFTFNSISGEKEDATLRLVMSNPVPRWQVILAKMIGNYAVLIIPFLISVVVGLILLNTSGVVSIFIHGLFLPFALILLVTLAFILAMCNLGLLISTLTHRSIISMITLLFIWTALVLSWPKISPMIATILYPVKPQQVNNSEKQLARQNLENELDRARRELFDDIVTSRFGLTFDQIHKETTEIVTKAKKAFGQARATLDKKYEERISSELKKIDREYLIRRNAQSAIARNLSRISPVSCYTYIVTEVSATGILELGNFLENSERFQQRVKQQLYDKGIHEWYGPTKTKGAWRIDTSVPGFDPEKQPVPHLSYKPTTLNRVLRTEWIDILLLFLFNIFFFAASYVGFLRYDVR
jgi:ABC-type transport system involved in multi-copper enzyme maturation permease subunit